MGFRRALAVATVLMLAGCATPQPAPTPPSPRAECAPANATIYFTEESATLQPLSRPLLQELMQRVQTCQTAGGDLRAIEIVAYPDRGVSARLAMAEMRLRSERVRDLLVELGAPADKIQRTHVRAVGDAPMQRRAEVTAHLY